MSAAYNIRGRVVGNRVLVNFAGVFAIDWHWKKVDEFCDVLRRLAEHARQVKPAGGGAIVSAASPKSDLVLSLSARLIARTEGAKIFVQLDGRQGFHVGADEALQLWEQLKGAARKAEEHDAVDQVIYDQALLTRIGAPFGLTDNPKLQDEAAKEAAWNSSLRRAIPGGVRSSEAFGTPTLVKDPPTKH